MFSLRPLPLYRRKLKKILARNPELKLRFERTLTLLALDPNAPSLESHKVKVKRGVFMSSRVTGDLRIIWLYANDTINVIDLIDVGGHDGSKSVYR